MINCTPNVAAAKPISKVAKWKVGDKIRDDLVDEDDPPEAVGTMIVPIILYGENGNRWPIKPVLFIRDSKPSRILVKNASPTTLLNEYVEQDSLLQVPGHSTPYTELRNAYYASTGKANMRKAVEALLVTVGAMPAELAGEQA